MEAPSHKAHHLISILSLDVVLGAIISSAFVSSILSVKLSVWHYGSLGLTVWIIYTADHLLDAMRVRRPASTTRHRFHQYYFKRIFVVWVIVTIINSFLVLRLPIEILSAGLMLVVPVLLYLRFQRHLSFMKEFAGALFYVAGVSLSPAVTKGSVSIVEITMLIHFFVVAWMNLLIFSFFDRTIDQRDRHTSFATQLGDRSTQMIIWTLIALSFAVAIFTYLSFSQGHAVILLIMTVVLASLMLFKKQFQANNLYRVVGDAVFFFPVVYWL